MTAAALGLAGSLLLHLFFASVRVQWPNSYITLRNRAEEAVSRGPLRYAVFRAGPFALVGLAVSATSDRLDLEKSVALTTLWLTHLAATNGRSFINSLRAGRVAANTITSNAITALGLLAVTYLLSTHGEQLSFLVPGLKDFVSALWTGLVAAVLAVLLQNFVRSDSQDIDLDDLSRNLGSRLESYIDTCASAHRVDPLLIRSIIYTEVLNRPRWFRGVERFFGRFRSDGTYGVGQARIGVSGSDQDSIEVVAANFDGTRVPRFSGTYTSVNSAALKALLERHNPSRPFVEMAVDIFTRLEALNAATTSLRGGDDQPLIIVKGGRRMGAMWHVYGTCDESAASSMRIINVLGTSASLHVDATGANGRRFWTATASVEEERMGFTIDEHPDFESEGTAAPYFYMLEGS